MTTTEIREGDIVRYRPDRADRWCREGMAIAEHRDEWFDYETNGRLFNVTLLFDTYWGHRGSDRHLLTHAERETVEVLFNLNDVEQVEGHSPLARKMKWERYAPEDRFMLSEQHRHYLYFYVRKGAQQDRAAELEQQRLAVEAALAARDGALSDLQYQRTRYHEMLADPTVRPWAV